MTRSPSAPRALAPNTVAPDALNGSAPNESGSPGGEVLTIGEVARRFGVTLRALRFYEDRGLLSPEREGTARFYAPDQLERLALILRGKRLGFTLSEIRDLLARHDARAGGNGADVQGSRAPGLALEPDQIREQILLLERQQAEIAEALSELRARLNGAG